MNAFFETKIFSPSQDHFNLIASLLEKNQVVALPTETVYGLAGNAFQVEAINKIFKAKERPSFDPLIVHVSNKNLTAPKGVLQALINQNIISSEILNWPNFNSLEKAIKQFWPGPLTFVLPRGSLIPNEVTSGQDTVAIRMPAHPLFQEILARLNFPLAAPSANRFGRISPTQAEHVSQELSGRIPAILDGGQCAIGLESTIIKVTDSGVILLRPGKIGAPELEKIFGILLLSPQLNVTKTATLSNEKSGALTPGMLDQHYAPAKRMLLVPHHFNQKEAITYLAEHALTFAKNKSVRAGILAASIFPSTIEAQLDHANIIVSDKRILSPSKNFSQMAQGLFSALRDLDNNPNVDLIIADLPNFSGAAIAERDSGLSFAIQDRLNRASTNKPI